MINISRRHQLPGTGSLITGERVAHMDWPNLVPVLGDLRWAIVGAVATRRYMQERATHDLDVAVLAEDSRVAEQRMAAANYTPRGQLSIPGSSWESPDGTPIDLIEVDSPWWPHAFSEAQANRDEDGAPVLTLPYLVLMKVMAGRSVDTSDVARMLGGASDKDLASVRDVIRQFAAADTDDVESLIAMGKLEISDGGGAAKE